MSKITWTQAKPFLINQVEQNIADCHLMQKQSLLIIRLYTDLKELQAAFEMALYRSPKLVDLYGPRIDYTPEQWDELRRSWDECFQGFNDAVETQKICSVVHAENMARYKRNQIRCHDSLCHAEVGVADLEPNEPLTE